jgi:hypothetical protein
MIAHFPVALLAPGILFILWGWYYRRRALAIDQGSTLGKHLASSNRKTGNVTMLLGTVLLVIAVPLTVVIHNLT